MSLFLKLNEVEERVCLKRSAIYSMIQAGDFPAPIKLMPGRSAWLVDDVDAWVKSRIEASRKPSTNGGADVR